MSLPLMEPPFVAVICSRRAMDARIRTVLPNESIAAIGVAERPAAKQSSEAGVLALSTPFQYPLCRCEPVAPADYRALGVVREVRLVLQPPNRD